MIERAIAACAALALAGSLVCGCAKKPESSIVTLRLVLWGTTDDEARLYESFKVFYRDHPNIRIKLEITPHARVFDKLLISYAGGRAPDVSRVSSLWFYPLAAKGILTDLMPFIESDRSFDLEDFYPVALDGWGRYRGRVHALPTDLDLEALFYNKRMFDREGIPYPDGTWDWKRYLDVCRKLTKDTDGDGKVDQWGSTVDGFWQNYIFQNGGSILNEDRVRCMLDRPEAHEAIQWMTDLRKKWGVTPSPADQADTGLTGIWASGRLGMFHSGSWAASLIFKDVVKDFEWDVAPLPKGKQRATFMGGSAFAIVKGTKHPKESWELVKFLTGKYLLAEWARQEQIMPSRRSVAESGAFLKLKEPPEHREVFLKAVEYGRTLPSVYSQQEMNDIVSNYISMAILGKSTAKQACLEVTPKVNELLAADRRRGQR